MRQPHRHAVRRRRLRFVAEVVFGTLLFIGLWMIAVGTAIVLTEQPFAEHGVTVTGTVVELGSTPRSNTSSYSVTYEFDAPELGARVRASDSVEQSDWQALRPGGPIAVTYLPEDPLKSRVRIRDLATPLLLAAMGAVFVAVGLILGIFVYRPVARIREAIHRGLRP